MTDPALPAWVQRALKECGRSPASTASATRLGGGVSADVLLVVSGDDRWVLKRPRERFQVADDWVVGVERARVEAEAARWFQKTLPAGSTAPLFACVEQDGVPVLVFEAAPPEWAPWKSELLSSKVRVDVARAAGGLLARIHASGTHLPPGSLRHDDLFHAQRVAPYLRMSARRVPPARTALKRLERSFFARDDLVHGDFSPKNLLVPPDEPRPMLIDHEVVTRGDAAFDVAFLWNHLALKAVHLPGSRLALLDCAEAARAGYAEVDVGDRREPEQVFERALVWLPALMLARVVGKSPVEYLSLVDRTRLVATAKRLLAQPPQDLPTLWEALPERG